MKNILLLILCAVSAATGCSKSEPEWRCGRLMPYRLEGLQNDEGYFKHNGVTWKPTPRAWIEECDEH